jgi:hypothetical protein
MLVVTMLTITREFNRTLAHRSETRAHSWSYATLLGLCLALSTTSARSTPPPQPTSPAAGLTTGDYRPGQGGATAAASNRQARLTVPRFRVSVAVGARQAPARHAFLTVSTEWQNIGSTNCLVAQVDNHLFLLINGDRQVTVSDATGMAPHPLEIDQLLLPATGSVVAGDVVFEIPDHGVKSLELLFIDSDQGNMSVPLFGRAPAELRAIAGPASNGLIEAAILGMHEAATVGGVHASAGQKYAVIDLRMRGLSPGNLIRFDPTRYLVLSDADGYSYRVISLEDLDDEFTVATQLIPLVPSRGTLAYLIPATHSALTLAINLPGYQAMALVLPNSGATAARAGKSLVSFEDPDTLTLNVLGLSRASSIGKVSAAAGKNYLILDLLFVSKVDQGIEFQAAEQLFLLDGQDQITVDPDALEALPHGLKEGSVIPAGGQARYQVIYQVPKAVAHFALRYRGFNSDTKKALPGVAAEGHGSS